MYKISIILPTFNVEKYLQKSLDSLISQTIGFSNLQLIYVDDCSTDNSLQVIDKYAEMYDNVISVHLNANSGSAGKPRNEGLKYAFADYVLFLDPDDYLMDDACETLYNKIIESDVDIVIGGYRKGDWIARWNSVLNADESLIEHPRNNVSLFLNPPGLAAKLFKKELIFRNNIKFAERIPAQDLVFLTECYLNANSILTLNDFVVYCYYVRDEVGNESITNNVTKKYLLNLLAAYNLTLDLLSKFNVNIKLKNLYFSRSHISFFTNQLKRSDLEGSELESFFNTEAFQKFRNQDYIFEDERINDFFEKVIEDYTAVDTSALGKIWPDVKNQYMNSDDYIPEKVYQPKHSNVPNQELKGNIDEDLHQFLKKTSKLKNIIADYKKIEK